MLETVWPTCSTAARPLLPSHPPIPPCSADTAAELRCDFAGNTDSFFRIYKTLRLRKSIQNFKAEKVYGLRRMLWPAQTALALTVVSRQSRCEP
jgi:hypothetical protein